MYLGNFPKFRPINSLSCLFKLNIGTHGILEMLIPKCLLCLKINIHGISRMLTFILTLVFWNSNLDLFFFGNFKSKKLIFLPQKKGGKLKNI